MPWPKLLMSQVVKRVDPSAAGLVTTVVSGDVGSVRAAVEAGASGCNAGRRTVSAATSSRVPPKALIQRVTSSNDRLSLLQICGSDPFGNPHSRLFQGRFDRSC